MISDSPISIGFMSIVVCRVLSLLLDFEKGVSMKYQRLGRSGIEVSRFCLGSNNFGGQVDQATSVATIRKALDLGVNMIDTANIYTDGKSEEIIGKAIGGDRDRVIIATKVGMSIGNGANEGGLSRRHILWQVRESLKRLATDFIDVYYLHCFDPETPLEETLRTMSDLVRDGKVRYLACSNFSAWQIAKAHAVCDRLGIEKFVAVQPPYNLLKRDAEQELLPYCREESLGVLAYSPLMGGFLTGKYSKNATPPTGSRGKYNPEFWDRVNGERNFVRLEKLSSLAEAAGVSISELAVAWILKNPTVTGAIIGASSPQQVEDNCKILEHELSPDIYQRINESTLE